MKSESKLKQFVCKNPFEYFDIQENSSYICCPSWCSKDVFTNNGKLGWDDYSNIDVRKSVLDGSYKYCDKNICPSLNKLLNTNEIPNNFVKKDKFVEYYSIQNLNDLNNIEFDCKNILFGFDRSCNLKCSSCRVGMVINDRIDSDEYKLKLNILNTIEQRLAKTLKSILITGSGDPFYSNLYRNYLINFDKSKYPNLDEIKIITNGIMLDEKLWNSLNAKDFIKSIEISIDAGTKQTYENVTRLNGNWDRLLSNLKFISQIKSVDFFQLSFVVSELNYMEMILFYDLITNIYRGRKFEVVFRQHVYWEDGKYTKEEVDSLSIFNISHKKHNLFLKELNKIYNKPFVNHNFNHLVKKNII